MNTNLNRFNRKWTLALAAAFLTAVLAACGSNATPDTSNGVPVRPDGVVTGVITNSTGQPLSNAPVTLQEYTLEAANTLQVQSSSFTDEHGQFGLNLTSAGTYALQATGEDEGVFELITVTSKDGKLTAQDLELTSAEYGMVELTVHAPDSTPAADSLVYLAGTNHIGMTNAAGRTTLTRVPAGNYTAVASGEGYGRSEGLSVTVKSAETTTGGPLELKSLRPVIHSVTPIVVNATDYGRVLVTIQGENFGHQRGLSQVLEPDWDDFQSMIDSVQVDSRILSWSDNEIILQTYNLLYLELQFDDPAAPDLWNRFQVVTAAGASNISDRVEVLYSGISIVDNDGYSYNENYVNSPTDSLNFRFELQATNEKLITDATITHSVTTGELTHGDLSDIEIYEEDYYEDYAYIHRSAYMNLVYEPAATQAEDSFTITSTTNGETTAIYGCTLYDASEWADTDWYWECWNEDPR